MPLRLLQILVGALGFFFERAADTVGLGPHELAVLVEELGDDDVNDRLQAGGVAVGQCDADCRRADHAVDFHVFLEPFASLLV